MSAHITFLELRLIRIHASVILWNQFRSLLAKPVTGFDHVAARYFRIDHALDLFTCKRRVIDVQQDTGRQQFITPARRRLQRLDHGTGKFCSRFQHFMRAGKNRGRLPGLVKQHAGRNRNRRVTVQQRRDGSTDCSGSMQSDAQVWPEIDAGQHQVRGVVFEQVPQSNQNRVCRFRVQMPVAFCELFKLQAPVHGCGHAGGASLFAWGDHADSVTPSLQNLLHDADSRRKMAIIVGQKNV